MTCVVFLLILIFVGCVWFVGSPLLQVVGSRKKDSSKPLEDLKLRKEEVLATLKELELDHQMKKMSDEDFNLVFAETFEKGKDLLKEIEDYRLPVDESSPSEGDACVAPTLRTSDVKNVSPKFCHQCGVSLLTGARFCSQCGVKIA